MHLRPTAAKLQGPRPQSKRSAVLRILAREHQQLSQQMEPPGLATLAFADTCPLEDGSMREFVEQLTKATPGRIYMHFDGPDLVQAGAPTPQLFRALGVLFDALAFLEPRKVAIPLIPSARWDADAMASIPEVALLAPSHVPAASVAYQQVTAARSALGMPPVDAVHLPHGVHARPAQHAPSQPGTGSVELETAAPAHVEWIKLPRILLPSGEQAGLQLESSSNSDNNGTGRSSVQGQGVPPLRFRRVAVGGTFDRLHAGHELLLAAAALIASEKVYVGITADKLLATKKLRELVQPYAVRAAAAEQYMSAVNPHIMVESGPLSDPQAPTQAELDPQMEAIVVSEETLPGALHINSGRVVRGFAPLLVLVVPVIGSIDPAHKLSSTHLREADAAAAAERQ